jgi:hypothetical protein
LPPVNWGPRETVHNQSAQPYPLLSLNLPPPQPLNSPLPQEAVLSSFYNGYPTPPSSLPSSPNHLFPNHHLNLSQPGKRDQQHDRHLPSPKSRASLSSRQRVDQELQLRESHWNIQKPHTHTSYSPNHEDSGPGAFRSDNSRHYSTLPFQNDLERAQKHQHAHSNKPYTREQVHFIRYLREDCQQGSKISWPEILALFLQQFPEYQSADPPLSVQCLSSRYYRANEAPMLDENGEPVLDSSGKVRMIRCKVRGRNMGQGKHIPYLLVDKHPDFALVYDWVKPEDKVKATRIVQALEKNGAENENSGMLPFARGKWTVLTIVIEWKKYQQSLRQLDCKSQDLLARQVHKGGRGMASSI